jgi:hypothetical protein
MLIRIGVILLIGLVAWAYQATRPPPPSICGSPGRPPVTAPRIKLRDERHLAYKDHGVSKEAANHNIIFIHGFGSCRHDPVVTTNLPQVLNSSYIWVPRLCFVILKFLLIDFVRKLREDRKQRRTQVNSRATSLLILDAFFSYKRNNI